MSRSSFLFFLKKKQDSSKHTGSWIESNGLYPFFVPLLPFNSCSPCSHEFFFHSIFCMLEFPHEFIREKRAFKEFKREVIDTCLALTIEQDVS